MRTIDAIVDALLKNIALNPMPFLVYRFHLNTDNIVQAEILLDDLDLAISHISEDQKSYDQQDLDALDKLITLARMHLKLLFIYLGYDNFSNNIASIYLVKIIPGTMPSDPKLKSFFCQCISAVYNLHGMLAAKAKVKIDGCSDPLRYAAMTFDKANEFTPERSLAENVIRANILSLLHKHLDIKDIELIYKELYRFLRNGDLENLKANEKVTFACMYDSLATTPLQSIDITQRRLLQQKAFSLWQRCPTICDNLAKLYYDHPEVTMDQVCFAIEIYKSIANISATTMLEISAHNMLAIQKLARMQLNYLLENNPEEQELQQYMHEIRATMYALNMAYTTTKNSLQRHQLSAQAVYLLQIQSEIKHVEFFINEIKGGIHPVHDEEHGARQSQAHGFIPSFIGFAHRNKYVLLTAALSTLCSIAAYNYGQDSEQQDPKMSLIG